jgi:DEAD/DEAH box helicase domain-containing protein
MSKAGEQLYLSVEQVLEGLRDDPQIGPNIVHWEVIPPRPPRYAEFPSGLDARLRDVLIKRGITRLYTHQASAIETVLGGKNIVVVTPTASGKTLCYNLPVLDRVLKNPSARALYMFPTKALSQDQLAELHGLITDLNEPIMTYTFDGDTPQEARRKVRHAGHIVITNPDMLHAGVLPHHTNWIKLFENLQYVVIDELHSYRGVFGSHLANVLRRLRRVCEFHGSKPQFILCSATIANPGELAEKIVGQPVETINNNGAPAGQKHFVFYNPPIVNKELGIRKSALNETSRLAERFLLNSIQTICFIPFRLNVEILLTYLKDSFRRHHRNPELLKGYRSGYRPLERREIERGLRDKSVLGVVSTNALELGIDIGQLEASIITGYPGSVASTWQQAGRAGRRQGTSVAIMVANSSAICQFLAQHPDYLLGASPEAGIVDADNLIILMSHIRCAAFELPFKAGEAFGESEIGEHLQYLEERGIVRRAGNKWHWMADSYPASEVSLRSAAPENFVIFDETDRSRVIGEVDYFSAPVYIFPDAIYLHGAEQYQITELDWDGKRAYAKPVEVDYYTDAEVKRELEVLEVDRQWDAGPVKYAHGDVRVTEVAVLFKKVRFHTHENMGSGRIHLPEQEMHTTAFWAELPQDTTAMLSLSGDALGAGLRGVANVIRQIAPLWLLCDPRDICSLQQVRSPFTEKPTLFVYDAIPAGVGFAEKLFTIRGELFRACLELVKGCRCEAGCPSCVGPSGEVGVDGKSGARALLEFLATY